MRRDVAEARRMLKLVTAELPDSIRDIVYNLAVKSYLKGYYEALFNIEKEGKQEDYE